MSATAEQVAATLKGTRTPSGWQARCPAHDDRTASLSIGEGEDGRLLLHCHAGCNFESIMKAAGVEPAKPNGKANGKDKLGPIVATYDYRDAQGKVVFQATRHNPKDFRQRRPDGNGGWIWNLQGIERVPYRLPQLLNASEVYIVEGEKDADNLAKLGLVATTNPGGADADGEGGKKWPEHFARWFDGRHVMLLPDNDDPGRRHVQAVARKLKSSAASIKVVELPGLPPKGDVSDWLATGGTKEELMALVAATPYWEVALPTDDATDDAQNPLDLIWADDIHVDLAESGLVDGLLCTGAMSVAYGESGCGKTFVSVDLACHIAAGLPWRDMPIEQGVVIYIAAESPKSVERRIWAWRQVHQPIACPVAVVRSHVDLCDPKATTPLLIAEVERIQAERGRVVLIVVDTLSRAMAGADENSAEDMTSFVGNCDRLRSVTQAHVLVVHHCGKDIAKGARGHSSLRAATDTEIEISNGTAKVTKQRDLETLGTYGFKLVPFDLGENPQGRMVTTCVVEPCDHAPSLDKTRKLGPNEQTVYDALLKLLCDPACTVSLGPHPQLGCRYVMHEQWRLAAARALPHAEPKRKSEAFDRALTSLVGNRRVQHIDGRFWIGLG